MCTRNIAAVFAAYFGITDPPEGLFAMVVLVVPLSAITADIAARLFARQVGQGFRNRPLAWGWTGDSELSRGSPLSMDHS